MQGKQQLNVLVDFTVWQAVRELARKRDEPIVAVVRAALEAYLASQATDVHAESTTAA